MADMLKARCAERRLKYFLASRLAFVGQQCISLAVDATRMGKKAVTSGCVALPTGVMAICPPQVLTHINKGHATNIR